MAGTLIFRTGQLGDTLTSLPAIAEIRKKHSGEPLYLLTQAMINGSVSAWDVFGPTGWFDQVIFYSASVASGWSLAKRIRALDPQRFYYFSQHRRTALSLKRDELFFRVFCGLRNCRGFEKPSRPGKRNGQWPSLDPEWKRLLNIVDPSARPTQSHFSLPVPTEAADGVDVWLRQNGLEASKIVAVAPGSKMPAKRWPLERYTDLGRRILESYGGIRLVIVGDSMDRAMAEVLAKKWGSRAFDFTGRPIFESAAMLKRCAAYIGNDTGAMHLAAAVGTPCLSIFSARDYPGLWEPFGQRNVTLRHETECAGCMLETCVEKDMKCLKAIDTQTVFAAAEPLLEDARRG